MISDYDIRTQLSNFQNHAPQSFFMSPKLECFIRRFRITEIFQSEKVRLRSLDLRRGHCFARANRAQFFVEFRPDRILSSFTEGREQTDSMSAELASHYDQRSAILVVRVRRNAHDRPGILEIEQRLI